MRPIRRLSAFAGAFLAAAAVSLWAGWSELGAESAPGSPGIDLEGIDHGVKPGDDFFAYANGAWLKKTEIPADRSTYGVTAEVDERTSERTADADPGGAARRRAAGSRRAQDRRLLRDLHGRGGDREAGPRARSAGARPHRGDRRQARRSPACSARRCAPTSTCSTTRTSTPTTSSGSGSRRTSTTRRSYSPFLLQGGLGMPDRDVLPRRPRRAWTEIRGQVPGARRARAGARAASPTPAAKAARDLRARDEDRARPREPRGVRGRREGQQPLDARGASRPRRPGLDWTAFFAAARPRRAAATSSSGSRGRSPASRRSSARSRSTTWKEYLDVPRARTPRACCRRLSPTRPSRSTARC